MHKIPPDLISKSLILKLSLFYYNHENTLTFLCKISTQIFNFSAAWYHTIWPIQCHTEIVYSTDTMYTLFTTNNVHKVHVVKLS